MFFRTNLFRDLVRRFFIRGVIPWKTTGFPRGRGARNREGSITRHRARKLEELIRREVADIIGKEVSDPRISFCTITFVKVSPDFQNARIGVSFMGRENEKEKNFRGIKSAEKYIRHKLAEKLTMRKAPDIAFVLDERPELRVEEVLRELHDERDKRENT